MDILELLIKIAVSYYGNINSQPQHFATPAMYEVNGKQYIAIACGGEN